jgi:hypothetical protein
MVRKVGGVWADVTIESDLLARLRIKTLMQFNANIPYDTKSSGTKADTRRLFQDCNAIQNIRDVIGQEQKP